MSKLWPSIEKALEGTDPATAIGVLANHMLALAKPAGLYVGIKIEPARNPAPKASAP